MRREFEMTEEQLERLLEACKPVPLIMLQCGMPRSPQQRANDAWASLGRELGFDAMSVKHGDVTNARLFTAEVVEPAKEK